MLKRKWIPVVPFGSFAPLRLCLMLFALSIVNSAAAQTITTIAGNGITQFIGDGSPATSLSIAQPKGLFADSKGHLYIADYLNSRIRMLSHDTISTIAGTGAPGYTGNGSAATSAQIGNPIGICMDTAGNWFITDQHNDVIRKVDAHTGLISIVCGSGTGGFGGDGSAATAANIEQPGAACVDPAGNIYIPDYGNHRIRKVDPGTGMITTIAGTGTAGYTGDNGAATDAQLSYPNSICLDTVGNLYFSEYGNNVVRKISKGTGIITTVAGSGIQGYAGDGSPATNAQLSQPNSVFVDKRGYLFISDYGNNVIRVVTPLGFIHTIAGTGAAGYTGDGGPATAATFRNPAGVFVDDAGYIFISDGDNSVIRKMTPLLPFRDEVNELNRLACNIFPNPSTGHFTITVSQPDDATLTIYNAIGQTVFSAPVTAARTDIDLSGSPVGIYLVAYATPSARTITKVVIWH